MMKKIFFILILMLSIKGFGQTFTLGLHVYLAPGTVSLSSDKQGTLYTVTNSQTWDVEHHPHLSAVKGTSFTFRLSANSSGCNENLTVTKTLTEMLRDSFQLSICKAGSSGYHTNFYPIYFYPNETITITNKNPSAELCSGEQLVLQATNANTYPYEVYHWQYSLNNKSTWLDLPASFNNNPNTVFTLQEILGGAHEQYYNKQIYFKLGYAHGGDFATPLAITYSPCAPLITNLLPLQPNCSGDPMTVIVTFDRALDPAKNETLKNFQIIKKDGQITNNQIRLITSFDLENPLQFTYKNVIGLENGEKYSVKYQAFQGAKERGIPPSEKDFTYYEPGPVTFSLAETNPLCHDNDAKVEITAHGGTGDYYYTLDTGLDKKFTFPVKVVTTKDPITQKDIETRTGIEIIAVSSTVPHKIKVRDEKGCIDKSAID